MIKKEKVIDRHRCIHAFVLSLIPPVVKYCSVQRCGKPCFALMGNAICKDNYMEKGK